MPESKDPDPTSTFLAAVGNSHEEATVSSLMLRRTLYILSRPAFDCWARGWRVGHLRVLASVLCALCG
jgi:hypothetical protein